MVACLSSISKAWFQSPSLCVCVCVCVCVSASLGVVVHTCNPRTWEVETRGSGIQNYTSKCGVNLGYIGPCLKTKQNNNNNSKGAAGGRVLR